MIDAVAWTVAVLALPAVVDVPVAWFVALVLLLVPRPQREQHRHERPGQRAKAALAWRL